MGNKEKSFNDVMYNEDGSFRPFVGHHGNISGDIADYRNTYMEAEREYFSQLLDDDDIREYLKYILYNNSSEQIFEAALDIQDKLENGCLETEEEKKEMMLMDPEEREQFHFNKLVKAEGTMCLLFASIKDKALILDEIRCWEERFDAMDNSNSYSR